MSTELPVPPEGPGLSSGEQPSSVRPRFSKRRLALAFAVAALSDGLSIYLTPVPPLQWVADGVTAILLFVVLGWQWILLPGLVMEAIPGINIFPFWLLVVGAVAMWGTARPNLKGIMPSGETRTSKG